MSKPFFIGIGVQKCASTWVHRILEDHPDVFVSEPKEVDFFSYHYHFGFKWYENHFPKGISGENSPSYFCDARVPKRIKDYAPNAKIIVCLRDPVARIKSHHSHEIRLGHVNADLPYNEALINNPMYVDQSLYANYLKTWLTVFPKNQILIVLQENIQTNPATVAQEIYSFLGVDTNFSSSFLTTKANKSQMPRSKNIEHVMKKSARVFRLLGLDGWVKAIKSQTWMKAMRKKNMRDIQSLTPLMTESDMQHLDRLLKDDLANLQQLIPNDLSLWPTWQRNFNPNKAKK